MGTLPQTITTISTSLQIIGTAVNGSLTGESTLIGKQGDVVQWIITATPISLAYKFLTSGDITLGGNSSLTVTNPTGLTTEGNIVFRVAYTIGSADSIQTLTVGGVGAILANTPALLTININDAVANATPTPASKVFNIAGLQTYAFTLLSDADYYIDPANIVVDVSGIASFNPTAASITRVTAASPAVANNQDNAKYSYDLTVPSTASSGTVAVSGVATLKTLLSWSIPTVNMTYAVFSAPYVGTYKISPFDTTNITATVSYSAIPANMTMTPTSATFVITNGAVAGSPVVASVTNTSIDAGTSFSAVYSIVLVSPSAAGIGAITTVTGGPVLAVVNNMIPITFDNTGLPAQTVASPSNVSTELTASHSWILIGGVNAVTALNPDTSFDVSLEANSTGVQRTGTITVSNTNTRISPALSNTTLTITQNA